MENIQSINDLKGKLKIIEHEEPKKFAELFLIIIEHVLVNKQGGEPYLACLLYNPKKDLREKYERYLSIINNPVIDFRHVLFDLNNNKTDDAFKHIDIIFENAINSSSHEELYNEWFLDISQYIYGMFKELKVVIDKMNQTHTPMNFKELFRTRIERVRKVTIKRTHIETKETIEEEMTRSLKRSKTDIKEKIRKELSNYDFDTLIDRRLSHLSPEMSDEGMNQINKLIDDAVQSKLQTYDINQRIDEYLNKKFEYTKIEEYHDSFCVSFKKLCDKMDVLDQEIKANQEINKDITKIQSELCSIRKSIRNNISAAEKAFSKLIEKRTEEVDSNVLNENSYVKTESNILKQKFILLNSKIVKINEFYDDKKNKIIESEKSTQEFIDSTKIKIGENMDSLKTYIESKKTSVDEVFSKFTDIKDKMNERIKTMSDYVTDFHQKMSAAMAGNAISLL
tara:strand:- start:506 stop:1864 length:1359 start_codon:yes stop_codon:yes gene_type:complete